MKANLDSTTVDQSPLVEIGRIPEIFCDSLAMMQRVGPNYKLIFATADVPVDCLDEPPERRVCVRLIMSAESVAVLRRQLETIEQHAIDNKPRPELRAVN